MPPVEPRFKLVFGAVVLIAVVTLGLNFFLVIRGVQTPEVSQLIETCSTVFKLSAGAIIGLLGGKTL